MKFLVVTYKPRYQGYLMPIPEKWEAAEVEAPDIDNVIDRLEIPPGGYCQVVELDHVTKVRKKCINEVVR